MLNTYEAWRNGRPVFNRLPGINGSYQANVVADYLAQFPDTELTSAKSKALDNIRRQVDPLTCDVSWLDFLSSICGWHGDYWDRSWPEASKRQLLANSYSLIWPKYGTSEALSFVLNTLGVTHLIQQGQSFIIGREAIGDALGAIAWEYDIVLPSAFFNSDAHRLAERIDRLFGPIWCRSRIIFDDEYFKQRGFLVIGESNGGAVLLDIGNGKVLEVN